MSTWNSKYYDTSALEKLYEADLVGPEAVVAPEKCDHSWSLYTGFNSAFYYCTKCDKKADKDPDVA